MQGDPDLHAPVLEDVDLLDPGHGAQGLGPVGPRLDHGAHPARRQLRERGVVVGGEADHFTPSVTGSLLGETVVQRGQTGPGGSARDRACTAQRREPVLEDNHVVAVRGYLRRAARRGRVQRALIGRRQERAFLARRGDDHPFAQQRIPAQRLLRRHLIRTRHLGQSFAQVTSLHAVQLRRLVEIYDLPAIGQARAVLPRQPTAARLHRLGAHRSHTVSAFRDLVRTGHVLGHLGPAGLRHFAQDTDPGN